MSKINEVIKALEDNGVSYSLRLSGWNGGCVCWLQDRITVRHGDVETCLDFEQGGEWFHRVIRKNHKTIWSEDGTENSLYGAYNSLVNPKKDLTERIASLREHSLHANPAAAELCQLKANAYQSVLDRL